jgi:DNA repair protein RadC
MKDKITMAAEIKVKYHPAISKRPTIICPIDAYVLFLPYFSDDTISLQEEFLVMFLNRANKVLGIHHHSKGSIKGTIVDIRLILSIALKVSASGIMLCHNHPSGTLKPSRQDIELTRRMKEAGALMEINILDHLIVSPEKDKFFSMTDEGVI